jgi:hypothetical protein
MYMSEYEKAAIIGSPAPTGKKQPLQTIPVNIITQKYEYLNTNLFDCVKNMLDIKYVVEYYGVQLNKADFGLCPFHSERTASFKIYADNNRFYCFGCGASGTVIDFASKMMGVSGIDALRRLNSDFLLNLPIDAPQTKEDHKQLQLQAEKRDNAKKYVKDFEMWERKTFSELCQRFRELHQRSKVILTPDDPQLWERIAELTEMPFLEWLIDTMIANIRDFKKQV